MLAAFRLVVSASSAGPPVRTPLLPLDDVATGELAGAGRPRGRRRAGHPAVVIRDPSQTENAERTDLRAIEALRTRDRIG